METRPTLSFSQETFAKLSPRPYLLAHLQKSTRPNGRSPTECRTPHFNNGSLTHADGSAVVRIGDTTVVCGVRGEILLASDQKVTDVEDLLVPNIELATGCSPAFLPGQPPSTLAQSLSTRVYSLLPSMVDFEDLRIGEEAYWVLYIDILFISLDGNAFDAAWAGTVAALRDVNLPKAHWDDGVVCEGGASLPLKAMPMALTFGVFGEWVLSDPDAFEEDLCDLVTIVVDGDRVLGISGGAGKESMREMVRKAKERWTEWKDLIE
jgi:exosome complex component RRP43